MDGIWTKHGKNLSRHVVRLLEVEKRGPQSLSYPSTAEVLLLDDDGETGSALFDVVCHSASGIGDLGPGSSMIQLVHLAYQDRQ